MIRRNAADRPRKKAGIDDTHPGTRSYVALPRCLRCPGRRLAPMGRHAGPQHGVRRERAPRSGSNRPANARPVNDRTAQRRQRQVGGETRRADPRQPDRRQRPGLRRDQQPPDPRRQQSSREGTTPAAGCSAWTSRRASCCGTWPCPGCRNGGPRTPTTATASARRPPIEGNRVYLVNDRTDVLCLDLEGLANGNDGPFQDEAEYLAAADDVQQRSAAEGGTAAHRCRHHLALQHLRAAGRPSARRHGLLAPDLWRLCFTCVPATASTAPRTRCSIRWPRA